MKLKFGDLLLAFGIREIEQLRDVFLWFGFINNMNSFRYCTNEMKLGNKPEADQDRSWNLSWTVIQCTKKGWLYSWIVSCNNSEMHTENSSLYGTTIRRAVTFQHFLKWGRSERRDAGNYENISKWKVENESEQNLLAQKWLSGFLTPPSPPGLLVNGSLKAPRSKLWARDRYIMSRTGVWKQTCEHQCSPAWAPALFPLPALLRTAVGAVQNVSVLLWDEQIAEGVWALCIPEKGTKILFPSRPYVCCLMIHWAYIYMFLIVVILGCACCEVETKKCTSILFCLLAANSPTRPFRTEFIPR